MVEHEKAIAAKDRISVIELKIANTNSTGSVSNVDFWLTLVNFMMAVLDEKRRMYVAADASRMTRERCLDLNRV